MRTGRHLAMLYELVKSLTEDNPVKAFVFESAPPYKEVMARGLGAFLRMPSQTKPEY